MQDIKQRTYENAPNIKGYWMVLGWGQVVSANKGFHELQVHFVKLHDDLEIDKTPDFFHIRMHKCNVIDIGSLRLFSPGSIWKDRRLVAQLSEYRNLPATFSILDISSSIKGKLGDYFDEQSNKFYVPKDASELPVRIFQNKIHYVDQKHRDTLIIPEAAIADYYSFGYFKLIDKILSGRVNVKNQVFDPSLSSCSIANDGTILAHVRLEKEMKDYDAFKIGRMASERYYLKKVREINASMISKKKEGNPVYIESDFPVKGPSELKVLGRKVETLKKGTVYFVYRIVGCSIKPIFDRLVYSRDNPGKTSEQEKGKERNEPAIVQKVFSEGFNVELGNSDPSRKNADINQSLLYEEILPITDDSIIKETDLLTQISNNAPITFLPAGLIDKISTRTEKIGNDEVVRIVLEFDQGVDSLRMDRFESQFEFIKNTISILEKNLANNLAFKKNILTPIESKKAHYQGYSIFPYKVFSEQDKNPNTDERYQWCFLNKSRNRNKSNVYYNERRAFLIEYEISRCYFYLIEVEAKYSSRNYLFTIRSRSGARLIKDDLIEFLFEIANLKGNGLKVKKGFSKNNKVEVNIFRHTTPEKLANDLHNWISKYLK